ncbi:MAG TPA: NADP transhydrogenase subunit alpha [Firmicutes bacterium]|jgi:opine dehydrogenase|nr:NADP transhydrogenase subunit alpha [Bacillota bacterium]HCF89998.1 NADP transhydrogenase subunit alpha [Bacillota bacterium]HCX70471.1 NADP transhydrogenase subunit alpha [Bacillota bacterium]
MNDPGNLPRFCVLGAGHGGMAMAGHLGLMGVSVKLYNRSEPRLEPIRLTGGIEVTGEIEGFSPIGVATSDIAEAIDETDVLMVVVPANGHKFMAEKVAPHLKDGQIVVLNPGRTGGAFEFRNILKQCHVEADVIVAEAQTLIYASRAMNPAQVKIFGIKNTIPVAALPGQRTVEVLQTLRKVYPQFVPGDNVLKTSLDNIGAIFHPALTVLNAGRIESTRGEFQFYMDGITPSLARILETLDAERVAVAAAIGIRAMPAREWLYVAYDAAGKTLYEAIQNNPGYEGIGAPAFVDHRYIWEDVPMSLVPIASIGDVLGVETTTMDAMIHLASLLNDTDYWAVGRTAERMGLEGLTVKEIRHLALEGEI